MAEGSIRIVRNSTPENGGGTGGARGLTLTAESDGDAPTVTVRDAPANGTSNATPRRRKHSETKRSTLSVEDRDGDQSSQVGGSKVQPNKTTPSPNAVQSTVAKVYNRKGKPRYYSADEAKQSAQFLLSAIEVTCTATCGPNGEMTELERGVMTPALSRVLSRTPIDIVEKANPIVDAGILLLFGAMYFSRVAGGLKLPSRSPTKGVQEDRSAPQAARVESTVDNTRAGDVDGIAVPVPSAITAHMNGAI